MAIQPARLAAAQLVKRRSQGLGSYVVEDVDGAKRSDSSYFTLLADADWEVGKVQPRSKRALTEEAFKALEDATAGVVDKAVVRMAVRHFADTQASGLGALVREREDLADRLVANSTQLAGLFSSPKQGTALEARLRSERVETEQRMMAIDAELKGRLPQYFALIQPVAMDVAAAQHLLGPDEAAIMIVPGKFGTHVFALTRDRIKWVRTPWTDNQVNEAVQRLLWDLGASVTITPTQQSLWQSEAGGRYAYKRATAFAIYEQLIAPVADVLNKRQIYIAATGSLTSLPFGALVMEQPIGNDADPKALRATRWFADKAALVQVPSLQTLEFLDLYSKAGTASGTSFVGFGAPALQGQDEIRGIGRPRAINVASFWASAPPIGGGHLADPTVIRKLQKLPGTIIELQQMRAALNAPSSSIFLGQQATEARVRSMDLSTVRILAFATHGVMAGELRAPAEPGLIFTPPKRASEADDGYLTASEISSLRLNADWVLLSACNTAAGDGSAGASGFSGLARAFFYAGARSLLVSHWPVRDDVAGKLTVRTISLQIQNSSLSRAEALQQAMREVREDATHDSPTDTWAHPGAWAPFTLVGAGR